MVAWNIYRKEKKNIWHNRVKDILLYGAETWRLTEVDERRINAIETDFEDHVEYHENTEYGTRELEK